MNKLTKLDKRSKLSIDVFNEEEMALYNETIDYIKENYEITDEIAIGQMARLFVFQTCLLNRLKEGFNVDITNSSKLLKDWLSEYNLTPKSKSTLNIDTTGMPVGWWAKMVEDHYFEQEAKKEKEGNK